MSPSLDQRLNQIDTPAPIVARSDTAKYYNVIPKDGKGEGDLKKIEGFIKAVIKVDSIFSYRGSGKALRLWTFNATQSQIDEIKKHEGVGEVEGNIFEGKIPRRPAFDHGRSLLCLVRGHKVNRAAGV